MRNQSTLLFLLPILLTIFSKCCFSEECGLIYGDPDGMNWAMSAKQVSDGGLIVTGLVKPFEPGPSTNNWILKIDNTGQIVWESNFKRKGMDMLLYATETNDGGYIAVGETGEYSNGDNDAWLLKLDANGDIEWEQAYGGEKDDSLSMIIENPQGGYVAVGTTASYSDNNEQSAWILFLNEIGELDSDVTNAHDEYTSATIITNTTDGGYAILGLTNSEEESPADILILKVDYEGDVMWEQTWGHVIDGEEQSGRADSIVELDEGNYLVTGVTNVYQNEGHDDNNIVMLTINAQGDIEQEDIIALEDNADALLANIKLFSNGSIFGAGAPMLKRSQKFVLFKIDQSHELSWEKSILLSSFKFLMLSAVEECNNGDIVVAGMATVEGYKHGAAWIARYSNEGECVWTE